MPEEKARKRKYGPVSEVAEHLRCSEKKIYAGLCRKSKNPFPIKAKKFGRQWLFDWGDVHEFMDHL